VKFLDLLYARHFAKMRCGFALLLLGIFGVMAHGTIVQLPLEVAGTPSRKSNANLSVRRHSSRISPTVSVADADILGYQTLQIAVAIGTPPQTFNLTFHYGMSTSFVLQKGYYEMPCYVRIDGGVWGPNNTRHVYDPTVSSTFQDLSYSDGGQLDAVTWYAPISDDIDCGDNNSGYSGAYLAADTFQVASGTTKNVSFYYVYSVEHLNPYWASDGVLALWSPTLKKILEGYNNSIVSVYLDSSFPALQDTVSAGYVTFGAKDTIHCGDWTDVPFDDGNIVVNKFALGSFSYNEKSVSSTLDSTSIYISTPSSAFDNIVSMLNAEYDYEDGIYTVNCSQVASFPDMVFHLTGVQYNVSSSLYTWKYTTLDGSDNCMLLLTENYDSDWIFGTPFLRAQCHAFDLEHNIVAFAEHKI
jgi:hypothetical protein